MTKEQWAAIRHRDARYDGVFYCACKTTGTVCRPSCPARTCLPANVVIFDRLEDALGSGYRPCKRCRPDYPDFSGARNELVKSARNYIRLHYNVKFSLDTLSDELHVNKCYLARTFRAVTGDTLLSFHNRVRCEEAEKLLTRMELSITEVAWRAGFSSPSHFSQVFEKYLGVSPRVYRKNYIRELEKIV